MLPFLRNQYKNRFLYIGVVYEACVNNYSKWMPLVQLPIWMSAIMSTTPDDANDICIGYVMNDCAMSYLSDIQSFISSYRKNLAPNFPKIKFPISKYNKEMIYDEIFSELKQHVVWCEIPKYTGNNDIKFEPCGKCNSCQHSPLYKLYAEKKDIFGNKKEFSEVINPDLKVLLSNEKVGIYPSTSEVDTVFNLK